VRGGAGRNVHRLALNKARVESDDAVLQATLLDADPEATIVLDPREARVCSGRCDQAQCMVAGLHDILQERFLLVTRPRSMHAACCPCYYFLVHTCCSDFGHCLSVQTATRHAGTAVVSL
jgi:hypothetical protein